METIAVLINDAAHARHMLLPMRTAAEPTHWILIACAPRLTRRIGRWVSHSQREHWREQWAQRLFAQVLPELGERPGDRVETQIAKRPLAQELAQLHAARGVGLRVLDARRPRLAQPEQPLDEQSAAQPNRWTVPIAVSGGLAMVLALTD